MCPDAVTPFACRYPWASAACSVPESNPETVVNIIMYRCCELSSDFCSQVDAIMSLICHKTSYPLLRPAVQWTTFALQSQHLYLYTFLRLFRTRRLDSLRQFKQVGHSKQRATCSQRDKYIHRSSISPTRWHRPQAAVIVVKPNPVLAPVLTECHRFELPLEQRMVRMCYSETSTFNVAMRRI